MTPTLLQAVLRRAKSLADDPTAAGASDTELLRRFADGRDERAFQTLLDRHGPLAWAVCRQMLPNPADAEDAFQAVFLALVQSAPKLGRVKSVGGWLHGVAVRVCLKVRRSAARRRTREERAAKPEADSAFPQWDDLHAAVHEEVERLPAVLRTVFVLCELEGVRQPDAAAKLGCKLGTVSGRLARARQALLKALTARGLAPVLAVGTVAVGSGAAAVPPVLAEKALALARGGTDAALAVPSGVWKLAQSVTEGTLMKTKLMVAAGIAAAGLMLTAVGGWGPVADAQDPPPPAREAPRAAPRPEPQPRPTPAEPPTRAPQPPVPARPPVPVDPTDTMPTRPDNPRAPQPPVPPRAPRAEDRLVPAGPVERTPLPADVAPRRSSQRMEHDIRELPGTVEKFEKLIRDQEAAGWEFAGQVTYEGKYYKLLFKRPKGNPSPAWTVPVPAPQPRIAPPVADDGELPPRRAVPQPPAPPRRAPEPSARDRILPPAREDEEFPLPSVIRGEGPGIEAVLPVPSQNLPLTMPVPLDLPASEPARMIPARAENAEIHVLELKHAAPADMSVHVKKFFEAVEVSTDEATGSLVVRCGKQTLEEIKKLVEKLDKPAKNRAPAGSVPAYSAVGG